MMYRSLTAFYTDGDERYFWLSILNGFVGALFNVGLVYGSAIYPQRLHEEIMSSRKTKLVSDHSNVSVSSNEDKKHKRTDTADWTRVISRDIENLNRFMRYLCRSFCVENMLFMIEVMQFKQAISEKYTKTSSDIGIDVGVFLKFYDAEKNKADIPKSSIVYNENNYTVNQQILKLYEKYIDENAALQVNISHETRQKLSEVVLSADFGTTENSDVEQLAKVFDEVITDVHILLSGLWWRFTSDHEDTLQLCDDISNADQQIVIALQDQTK